MNRLGDTSAFVNKAGQLWLTRRGKPRMDGVGIVFELYTAPLLGHTRKRQLTCFIFIGIGHFIISFY